MKPPTHTQALAITQPHNATTKRNDGQRDTLIDKQTDRQTHKTDRQTNTQTIYSPLSFIDSMMDDVCSPDMPNEQAKTQIDQQTNSKITKQTTSMPDGASAHVLIWSEITRRLLCLS